MSYRTHACMCVGQFLYNTFPPHPLKPNSFVTIVTFVKMCKNSKVESKKTKHRMNDGSFGRARKRKHPCHTPTEKMVVASYHTSSATFNDKKPDMISAELFLSSLEKKQILNLE